MLSVGNTAHTAHSCQRLPCHRGVSTSRPSAQFRSLVLGTICPPSPWSSRDNGVSLAQVLVSFHLEDTLTPI